MPEKVVTYTAQPIAEILHMSHRGVLLLINQGRIKAVRVGRKWLVSEEELLRIMEEGV